MLAPESASFTATATSAASSTAPPAAISAPPRNFALSGCGRLASSRPAGGVQRQVLSEDRPLELPKRPTRLEPQLVDEAIAGGVVSLEGVGLAAGSVQSEHELTLEALAQRMLADQRLELAHQPRVLARRQIRVDPILEHDQTSLFQPSDLRLGERLVGEIAQRRPPP